MNRRLIKKRIITLLGDGDLPGIQEGLKEYPEPGMLNALFSCLCHPDELVRWHAVSAFGIVVPGMAARNLEQARTVMRRFLWMLNDESGGIGWGVPEAMGEVMASSDSLADEYLHMLVSYTLDDGPEMFQDGNFLELDLLQEGVLWGLCRIAPRWCPRLRELGLGENLGVYFHSPNSNVRGQVCRLSSILKWTPLQEHLDELLTDSSPVRYYDEGAFITTTVAHLASAAVS